MVKKALALAVVLSGSVLAFSWYQSASSGQEKKAAPQLPPAPRPTYFAATPEAVAANAAPNSTDKMTDGLNAIAAGGWSLVAIDAGNKDRPSYYVFQRSR